MSRRKIAGPKENAISKTAVKLIRAIPTLTSSFRHLYPGAQIPGGLGIVSALLRGRSGDARAFDSGNAIEFAPLAITNHCGKHWPRRRLIWNIGGGTTPLRVWQALINRDYAEAQTAAGYFPAGRLSGRDFTFYYPKAWYEPSSPALRRSRRCSCCLPEVRAILDKRWK